MRAILLLLAAAPVALAQGKAGWLPTLAQAKNQAIKEGKPIMAVLRCEP